MLRMGISRLDFSPSSYWGGIRRRMRFHARHAHLMVVTTLCRWHSVLPFMIVHHAFTTPMLMAAAGCDHRLVLPGVQLG